MDKPKNPWSSIELSDYMVHKSDIEAFENHNTNAKAQFKFLPFLTPEPWIGNHDADIFILLANPGATRENVAGKRERNTTRHKLSIANLHGEDLSFPHYFRDPRLKSDPGGKWWTRALGRLIKDTSREKVANAVTSLEALPYHSGQFSEPKIPFSTQSYTNFLLHRAMSRDAFIVVYRQPEYWFRIAPELKSYPHKTTSPNTTQSVWITPGNLRNGYEELVERVRRF
jgi:hypothetical protein